MTASLCCKCLAWGLGCCSSAVRKKKRRRKSNAISLGGSCQQDRPGGNYKLRQSRQMGIDQLASNSQREFRPRCGRGPCWWNATPHDKRGAAWGNYISTDDTAGAARPISGWDKIADCGVWGKEHWHGQHRLHRLLASAIIFKLCLEGEAADVQTVNCRCMEAAPCALRAPDKTDCGRDPTVHTNAANADRGLTTHGSAAPGVCFETFGASADIVKWLRCGRLGRISCYLQYPAAGLGATIRLETSQGSAAGMRHDAGVMPTATFVVWCIADGIPEIWLNIVRAADVGRAYGQCMQARHDIRCDGSSVLVCRGARHRSDMQGALQGAGAPYT